MQRSHSWRRHGRSVRRATLAAAAAAAVLAVDPRQTHAAVVDWDTVAGSPIDGGSGSWDTSTPNWTVNGGATNIPWVNGNNDIAQFGVNAGTVSIATPVTANGLTFNTGGYLVEHNGNAANTITLAGATPTFNVNTLTATDTATVTAVIAGAGGLTKTGIGTLILSGANTFQGDIFLNGGTLQVAMGNGITGPLGSVANPATTSKTVFLTNNAVFRSTTAPQFNDNTGTASVLQIVFNIGASGGTLDTPGGTTTILDDNSAAGAAQNAAQLQGTGTLTKTGTGTLSLGNGGSNFGTFSGAIVVNEGTLNLGALTTGSNSLGTQAVGTTINAGAVLNINANNIGTEPITINGAGLSSGPVGALIGNGGTVGGTVTLGSDAAIGGGAGTLTLAGVVTDGAGSFSLTKVGTALTILSNAGNAWDGPTFIQGGALRGTIGSSIPSTSNLNINGLIPTGAVFETAANLVGTLGTGPGQIQLPGGNSGFSAGAAGNVTVSLDGGAPLQWGTTPGFNPGALVLNYTSSLGTLDFQNPIDLNGAGRTIAGAGTAAFPATISGPITSTGGPVQLTIGTGSNTGAVRLTNAGNTGIGSLMLNSGTVGYATDANIGGPTTPLTFNGGGIQVLGTAVNDFGAHPTTFTPDKLVVLDIADAANTFTVPASLPLTTTSPNTGHSLTKAGAGTLVLAAPVNTIVTLNMNGGTLEIGSGTLNLSNLGGTTIRGTADSTINGTGGGRIVLSSFEAGSVNYADNSVSAGVTLTINAIVGGADPTVGFEYCCDNPGGTIVLANPLNDFGGNIYIHRNGTIQVPGIGNQNAAASHLGKGTTIHFGTTTNTGRLLYTGTGEVTDRIINLNGTTAGGTLEHGGTGLLKFTNAFTATGAGAKTFTLQGSTAGVGEIAGIIPNSTAATSITKAGTGTWVLSAANTYTGTTTVLGGTLRSGIDNAFGAANPLAFGNITGAAGTLDLSTFNQTISTLNVNTSSNTNANTLTVGPGKTLTINGNVVIGPAAPTATQQSKLTIGGGGALVQTTAAGGLFQVGGSTTGTTGNAGNNAILDLTGLSSATINVSATGTFRVNNPQGGNTAGVRAQLLMPTPVVADGTPVTTVTAQNFNVGDNGGNQGSANQFNSLVLGTGLTTLNVNAINIGTGGRDIGSITYAAGNGSLKLRAADGVGRAAINLASNTANTGVIAVVPNALDLAGHSADLLVSTLTIGGQNRNTDRTDNVTFDAGTLDATAVVVGRTNGAANTTAAASNTWRANLNLGGGTTTIGAGGIDIANGSIAVNGTDVLIGTVNVSGGTTTVADNPTFGAAIRMSNNTVAANLTANSAVNVTGGSLTLAGNVIKGASTGAGTATVTVNGGTFDLSGFNLGSATGLVAPVAQSGVMRNIGPINGTAGLTKTTVGTLLMNGTNTYTGPTTVSEGTLGGTGSLAGPILVSAGAMLAPGASPGILSTGSATLASGSTFLAELAGTTAGTGHDQLNVTGTVDLGGATLTLVELTRPLVGDTFVIVNNDGADAVTGTFAGLPDESTITAAFNQYRISYDGPTSGDNDVVLTALTSNPVPEPAALGLLGVAGAALLGRRRRRAN